MVRFGLRIDPTWQYLNPRPYPSVGKIKNEKEKNMIFFLCGYNPGYLQDNTWVTLPGEA